MSSTHKISISTLTTLFSLLLSSFYHSSSSTSIQSPFQLSSISSRPTTTTTTPPLSSQTVTFIDLLSNSTSYSSLLYLVQRARLVPIINLLNSSTFFAPTNDAIETHPLLSLALNPESHQASSNPDNIQLELRQTLLYHFLNFSLPSSIPSDTPAMLETLLFPLPVNQSIVPRHPGETPVESPPSLLGGKGQKLRAIQRDEKVYLEVDSNGENGTLLRLNESQLASNGILIPLDRVLTPPPRLSALIRSTPQLSILAEVLSEDFFDQLDSTPHLTIFAPENEAWNSLDPIELSYLKTNFSSDDAIKVFQSFSSPAGLPQDQPGYYHQLLQAVRQANEPVPVTTTQGHQLSVDVDPRTETLTVNGTKITGHDLLTNNGVLHLVPQLFLPDGTVTLSLEKYLLALNCTKLVSLFRSANLSTTYLGNSTVEPYTILAPRDDVFDGFDPSLSGAPSDRWATLPANDSQDLRDVLKYHVVRGVHPPEELSDGMLLSTELDLKRTNGSLKQQILVSVSASDGKGTSRSDKKRSLIGFGGVNVVGVEPVRVGNSLIYLISQIIERPSDLLEVALSDLKLSTCVASIFAAGIDEELKTFPGLSYFIPTNKAFESLGLIMDYLLLGKSKSDLARLLRYHAIQEVVYLRKIPVGDSHRYPTLEGTEIYISKPDGDNVTLHGPTSHGLPLNGEIRDSEVVNKHDRLIETGSLNVINQVELPASLDIDISKLMAGAKASTMVDLIKASNMSWVLHKNLSGLPDQDQERNARFENSYTVLCPTDEAFTKINLTYYLESPILLKSLVMQHIIPTKPPSAGNVKSRPDLKPAPFHPLVLGDGIVYSTLLSRSEGGPSGYGDVSLRMNTILEKNSEETNEDQAKWLIGIKGARGTNGDHDSARILNYGRVTPILMEDDQVFVSLAGGVLSLNKVLEPYEPNWWERWGQSLVGWIIVLGFVGALSFLVWRLWIKKKNHSTGYQFLEPMEE
ncbi:uncharacterized protein MELLADRAFT_78612 [Melampsora larici-populina 98AG31]|uniref:FAS1 domain-containing protein n=1 Tax=Melampsora larici-populina (strain 98AG31 / pathotype 3-4-7) TaxID=747676 RepID=F4RWI9_MELLP|nr:uncharacterized protein MELLADRAFT_78612 [Melampsora larici-populina 98AG31]EGG03292.1 hypothetical protein MELLADRAFT_78612 [Melampsora larici-populina 98AG31]